MQLAVAPSAAQAADGSNRLLHPRAAAAQSVRRQPFGLQEPREPMTTRFCGWSSLLTVPLIVSAGCSLHQNPAVSPGTPWQHLNEGYSLLHKLLSQEKNVDKILWVKLESRETQDVIEEVAGACGKGVETLTAFREAESRLSFEAPGLPPAETETRKAIEWTRTKALLGSSGRSFEFQLLQTQLEALTYGYHLARVLSGMEISADRKARLASLSDNLERLHYKLLVTASSWLEKER